MPIYEFKCEKCGAVSELLLKHSETFDQLCACGGALIKQISLIGNIEFKGTGFYKTDYKGKE